MDLQSLRSLNKIGTILFCIFHFLLFFGNFSVFFFIFISPNIYSFICTAIVIIWICFIIFLTLKLHNNTVIALDKGNYEIAKKWTFYGIFIGILGGIIPFILFIISYIMFDEAIRIQLYGQPYYQQQMGVVKYCNNCRRSIPYDSLICPYCGVKQVSTNSTSKKLPPPPKSKKSISPQNQNHKPLPPPPKKYKKEK